MRLGRISLGATVLAAAAFAADRPVEPAPPVSPTLASPARHYSIKLASLFAAPTLPMGLFLRARIDGGPVLNFLLDSGAQHIVLDKRSAALLGRSAGASLDMVGLGAMDKTARSVGTASVQIGDLVLRNCSLVAVDRKLLEGIDGVIPLALFAGFLVRLDIPRKTLDLDPYPADPPSSAEGYSPVLADNRLLYVEAAVNDSEPGPALLDTGATYSAISPAAARAWKYYRVALPFVSLRVSAGDAEGFLLPPGIRFHVGPHLLFADPAVVVDFSDIDRHHQFAVTGLIGYSALRRYVVTIDYRDSLVRMANR
jgi:hypothetical protein